MIRTLVLITLGMTGCTSTQPVANAPEQPVTSSKSFTATAYSVQGSSIKGVPSQPGVVAADPKIISLGSSIRVTEAGKYSGVYVVTDTGAAITGRKIDIFVSEPGEAKLFGTKEVQVEVLAPGDNVKNKPETTAEIPKSSLAPAQKKEAATIPSESVPADKAAVDQGRAVKAQQRAHAKAASSKQ